jgi:hypothetical protein
LVCGLNHRGAAELPWGPSGDDRSYKWSRYRHPELAVFVDVSPVDLGAVVPVQLKEPPQDAAM